MLVLISSNIKRYIPYTYKAGIDGEFFVRMKL
jgi:hypothetical protein